LTVQFYNIRSAARFCLVNGITVIGLKMSDFSAIDDIRRVSNEFHAGRNGNNDQHKRIVSLNRKQEAKAVARIADRTASQHLRGSRDVIGHDHLIPNLPFSVGVL